MSLSYVFFTGLEERNCLEMASPAFCEEMMLEIQEGKGNRSVIDPGRDGRQAPNWVESPGGAGQATSRHTSQGGQTARTTWLGNENVSSD